MTTHSEQIAPPNIEAPAKPSAMPIGQNSAAHPQLSAWAQFIYDLKWSLLRNANRPGRWQRVVARIVRIPLNPVIAFLLRKNPIVRTRVWNRQLFLEANHHLPYIVSCLPMWSLPLINAVQALEKESVQLIDIGANIGDTVALLDSHLPGRCKYLCVEPDDRFHTLCRLNTIDNDRVTLEKCFVGDTGSAELVVQHREPGTATTRISSTPTNGKTEGGQRGKTLDEVAATLGNAHIDLIKIDTDGFDYKVLRSGVRTLTNHRPLLFFEWDPALWEAQGEDPLEVFAFLGRLGYSYFAFFADNGLFYSAVSLADKAALDSLRAAIRARAGVDNLYFDVLAGPAEICKKAVDANVQAIGEFNRTKPEWQRMQPAYWQ